MKIRTIAAALLAAACHLPALAATPAEQRIVAAQRLIEHRPDEAQPYVELAMALARRARESGDPAFYARAEEALGQAARHAPASLEAEKAAVWILLGKHEFTAALARAEALNRQVPDDLQVYGFLVDANAELGRYEAAERAAQWMLDLRPGNVAGLTRAAYLREIFGDLDGALALMDQAYRRTPPTEGEERAWLLTQMGHLHRIAGRLPLAAAVLGEALALFPDYHYALGELAAVRTTQGLHREAARLQARRYALAPHPENLHALALALKAAGRGAGARAAWREFERLALAESAAADNANHELVDYYLGVARRPLQGLAVAQREFSRRQDVHSRSAYARALEANGRRAEARAQLREVLAVGTVDPQIRQLARRLKVAPPAVTVPAMLGGSAPGAGG